MLQIPATPELEKRFHAAMQQGGYIDPETFMADIITAWEGQQKEDERKIIALRQKLEKAEQKGGSFTIEEYKARFLPKRAAFIKEHGLNA